jgi:hypothetical protein
MCLNVGLVEESLGGFGKVAGEEEEGEEHKGEKVEHFIGRCCVVVLWLCISIVHSYLPLIWALSQIKICKWLKETE